jgi:hypothetical protein
VKTYPGHRFDEAEIRSLQNSAGPRIGFTGPYRSNDGDVADIDAQVLEEEIATGSLSLAEFDRFCESSGLPARDEGGGLNPASAQEYLERQWGQEVFTVELPTNEVAACKMYAALVGYARERRFRLWSPMPGVGDIDLSTPGPLPPLWHQYSSREVQGTQLEETSAKEPAPADRPRD